jgi:hypothetical protein
MGSIQDRKRAVANTSSGRILPLNPQLAPILRAWKARCRTTAEGFVFPAPLPENRGKLSREQVVELRRRPRPAPLPPRLAAPRAAFHGLRGCQGYGSLSRAGDRRGSARSLVDRAGPRAQNPISQALASGDSPPARNTYPMI